MYRITLVASVALAIAARPDALAGTDDDPHLVYVDLLGKGGLWGAGYEWRTHRFAAGAVGSAYLVGGDRYVTLSPYVAAFPLDSGWFVHVGPQLVRRSTPSPGPEWRGMSVTSLDVEVSSGYQWRRGRLVIRAYAMASVGERLVPTIGGTLGWSL